MAKPGNTQASKTRHTAWKEGEIIFRLIAAVVGLSLSLGELGIAQTLSWRTLGLLCCAGISLLVIIRCHDSLQLDDQQSTDNDDWF